MSGKRYTNEFKIEAVRQVTDRGYSVSEVAEPWWRRRYLPGCYLESAQHGICRSRINVCDASVAENRDGTESGC